MSKRYFGTDGIRGTVNKGNITGEKFYRLVGGCIEFGEKSEEALIREFKEELELEIDEIKLLSVFESLFMFNGKKLHEIVFLFDSKFVKQEIYKKKNIDFNVLEFTKSFSW